MPNKMTLLDAKTNEELRVVDIMAGCRLQQSLAHLGVEVGSLIRIRRNAPFSGPLIINCNGAETAIGRGIASKIFVEPAT